MELINQYFLLEDEDISKLRKIIGRIDVNSNTVLNELEQKLLEIQSNFKNNEQVKKLKFYNELFGDRNSIFSTLILLLKSFRKSFKKARPSYRNLLQRSKSLVKKLLKKDDDEENNDANFENIKYPVSIHTAFYKYIKFLCFLIIKMDSYKNKNDNNSEEQLNLSEKSVNNLQYFMNELVKIKKYFDRLRGQSTNGILLDGLYLLNLKRELGIINAKEDNDNLKSLHDDTDLSGGGLDFYKVINFLDIALSRKFQKNVYNKSFTLYMRKENGMNVKKYYYNIINLNELIEERLKNSGESVENVTNGDKKKDKNKKNKKSKISKNQIKTSKINFMDALQGFRQSLDDLNLTDDQKQQAIKKFVDSNRGKLLTDSVLTESLPAIRWRRNPRLGLNKIVLTCKSDEYKKSLNRTISISGKKIKDVMCLPKSAKPAGQRLKDRKTSLKRWKTLNAKPAQLKRIKFKKNETRRQSKTIRKET